MGKSVRDRTRDGVRGLAALILLGGPAFAGEAVVENVQLERTGEGTFRASVTVRHADEGWDHYADRWVVLDDNGAQLAERVLAHPHVDEQPFTRSTSVTIPEAVKRVRVRARDNVHGEGPESDWIAVPH